MGEIWALRRGGRDLELVPRVWPKLLDGALRNDGCCAVRMNQEATVATVLHADLVAEDFKTRTAEVLRWLPR